MNISGLNQDCELRIQLDTVSHIQLDCLNIQLDGCSYYRSISDYRSARVAMRCEASQVNGNICADRCPMDQSTVILPSTRLVRKRQINPAGKRLNDRTTTIGSIAHPVCVGEEDKEILGIWTYRSCRILLTFVESLLFNTSLLESAVNTLEESNHQLVTLVVEQQQVCSLRDDIMEEGRRQNTEADVACVRAQGMTLLVGNSMSRDVRLSKAADRKQVKILRKSGVTFTDIGDMTDNIQSAAES